MRLAWFRSAALEVLTVTGRNINRERLLVVALFHLRRHLAICKACKSGMAAEDFDMLCDLAKRDLLEVAVKWDTSISKRLTARNSKSEHIFPCPDPNAHGELYAATAEPVVVIAHVDTLF